MRSILIGLACFLLMRFSVSFSDPVSRIPEVMDKIVRKIYEENKVASFEHIDQKSILSYVDAQSLAVLENDYWIFEISTDAEVFVCRDINQKEVPFWLVRTGFQKTEERISNENVNYEVWRKVFKKGKVNLGINGFDRHRFVYFVAVQPLNKTNQLDIKPIWPSNQQVNPLQLGSFIYHDWDELIVKAMPSSWTNAFILPTNRGRSREAHLMNAFRKTNYPSSLVPDQLLLSWVDNPMTSQHITWRTKAEVVNSHFAYWQRGEKDTLFFKTQKEEIKDRLLTNDPNVNRFNVDLKNLTPGTTYDYFIETAGIRTKDYSFTTDSGHGDFEFAWFGDLHNDSSWGAQLPKWNRMFPKTNFYLQVGDLVNTGQYRDHWDELLQAAKPITDHKPFMAVPGNHDSQEGIFPSMYLSYLKYPKNGPKNLTQGLSYHFTYSNTLFLMLDAVTFSAKDQKEWIDRVLRESKETFKIVCFHFAPHTLESTYSDLIGNWEPLFIKYGVDLVLNGHFHYYLRTTPKISNNNKPIYVMSIGTKGKEKEVSLTDVDKHAFKAYLYQQVKITSTTLSMTSVDSVGTIIDHFEISKK